MSNPILSLNDKVLNTEYRVCKQCGVEKERIRVGFYPNGEDLKALDRDNRQWNGSLCPTCHNDNRKAYQKHKRAKLKSNREKINAKRRERYKLTGK